MDNLGPKLMTVMKYFPKTLLVNSEKLLLKLLSLGMTVFMFVLRSGCKRRQADATNSELEPKSIPQAITFVGKMLPIDKRRTLEIKGCCNRIFFDAT